MKKKFTFLMAALMLLTMMVLPGNAVGQTTITFTSASSVTQGNVTVTCAIGAGTNAPAWTSGQLRLYASNTITITPSSGYRITGLSYSYNKQGSKAFASASMTSTDGSYSETNNEQFPVTGTWSGTTTNAVVITLGNSGQRVFNSVTVTTSQVPTKPTITINTPTGGEIAVTNTSTSANVTSGSEVTTDTGLTLSATPATGYSWSSWNVYKTGDQSTTVTVTNNQFSMPSYNTTVDATFTKNNYNVTLGTIDDVVLTASDLSDIDIAEGETEAVPYGTELILNAGSMVSGKMFAWKVVKTGVTPEAVVTNDVLSSVSADGAILTVPDYAVTVSGTVQDIQYYVTYNANGGTGTLVDPDSPYTPGDDVTVLANTFTRSGYVFTKWNTENDGTGEAYDADEIIENIDADVTLYAQWAEAWTVTLNANGSESTVLVAKTNSTTLTAPANIPDGYVYKGWTANASTPSVWVSNTYTPTADVTLYAVYAKTVQEYGTTVFVLDGSNFDNANYTKDSGTKSQALGSGASNNFSSNAAIFVTKNGGYIYNNNAFGTEITKLEIYANKGGSSAATAGVYFSTTAYETKPTGDYNWTSSGGIGDDAVIDASSGLSEGVKYFCFVSTKSDKNAQVQLRITYRTAIYYTRIYPSGDVKPGENTTITTPTVISSGTVMDMETYSLTIGSGGSLTIEDGGQLICSNSVAATVKKSISAATAKTPTNWYGISSSVHKAGQTYEEMGSVTNLLGGTYDMFYYKESESKWINQKATVSPYAAAYTNMESCRGYIYRNAANVVLSYSGETNVGEISQYTLSYTSELTNDALKGINLVGNPYPHKIYKGVAFAVTADTLETGYYTIGGDGACTSTLNSVAIDVNQAVLVKAKSGTNGMKLTFKDRTKAPAAKSNNDNIKFIVSNSQYEDVAYALFDKGAGLDKINHRNADIPMIYISQDDNNYAIATMGDDTKSFNLNFKAMTTGKYTLSYKADGNFSYLHVIDRLTGEDVDMLLEGEYSFIASPIDSENRFIVRLEYSAGSEISESSIFAYQSGNDIIVNGEGELQIFDVMGRRVSTQYVSGVETINLQSHGVYIFKLNEKTQKIVVK